ncbi:MAG: histidine kinase N-terminal 7TM domain-containing protein, partial [Chloroflexota bacterium]
MSWPAPPDSIIRLAAAVISLLIARTAWKRRGIPGVRAFAALMLAAGWWALFAAFEYATDQLAWRILWSKVQYLGIACLPPLYLSFTLSYTQLINNERIRSALRSPLFYAIPAAAVLLVFTNELHGWIWPAITPFSEANGTLNFHFEHGWAFWLLILYSYTLLLGGSLVLIVAAARFPPVYRPQAAAVITGAAIPWISNLFYVLDLGPWSQTDMTPVAFALVGVIYAVSVFRFYLFDVVPVGQESVIESMTDGLLILNAQKRVVYANPVVSRMLYAGSRPSEAWTGRPQDELLQDFPKLLQVINQAGQAQAEVKLPGPPARTLEVQTSIIQGPRGETNGQMVILRDITRRKLQEEQLQLQSVALESAANGIVITDRQGVITWINPAFTKITGYTPEEAVGHTPSILKSGGQSAEFYADLWRTILSGQTWSGELKNRHKDGTLYFEEQTIAPVRSPEGEITHFIGIKQDITTRKNLEETRDDLLKSIVHDLRNPLNSILLSMEMFKSYPEP